MSILEKPAVSRRPPGLSPFLAEVLNDVIDCMIKNATPVVNENLIGPIKALSKAGSDLAPILYNSHLVSKVPHSLHISVLRRAALGSLWRRTVNKTLSQSVVLDEGRLSRQRACPPIGFVGSGASAQFPCRSLYCPHCHCRSALKTLDRFKKALPEPDPNILVLRVENEFKDKLVGFEATPFHSNRRVRSALEGVECLCLRIRGACVNNEKPSSVESYMVVSASKKIHLSAYRKLSRLRAKMSAEGHVTRLKSEKSLEAGVARAYECCPLVLTTLSKTPDDNALLHCLDSYHDVMAGAKRVHVVAGAKLFTPPVQVAISEYAATLDVQGLDERLETLEIGETQ